MTVAVVRIRIDGTITGRIRGTSIDLLTLVAGTGLPVRWQRSVDTLADAFGSTVRYQEQAQFDLVSLHPDLSQIPVTGRARATCSSGRGDLNPRPPAPKAGALPAALLPVTAARLGHVNRCQKAGGPPLHSPSA